MYKAPEEAGFRLTQGGRENPAMFPGEPAAYGEIAEAERALEEAGFRLR